MTELSVASHIHLTVSEKELIQNAHASYEKIILEKEFGDGFSKTRVFLIVPVRANGTKDARIVTKIGLAAELHGEKENYDNFVSAALPFTAAQVKHYYPQGDQAAVTYIFTGGESLGETTSLEGYYHAQPAEDINHTLNVLLDQTLGAAWYGQNQPHHCLFGDEYGGHHLLPHEEFGKIVSAIYPRLASAGERQIQIPGVSGIYPDPLSLYPTILDRTLHSRRSFVHGDLHVRNVLVDQTRKAWLIDFAKVKERHNIFDFIKLETYIRLMALAQIFGAFSLNEYAQFEQALNNQTATPVNPELAKAYQVIQNIRHIAQNYMGRKTDFKNEYFPALFLYALSMLKYFSVNGHAPTQLMYVTACVTGKFMLEPDEPVKKENPLSQVATRRVTTTNEANKMTNQKNPQPGGIHIGGNASGNVIISGNNNKVEQKTHYITNSNGSSADEIAKAFALIEAKAHQENDSSIKEESLGFIKKLKAEAEKGQNAEENLVQRYFNFLAAASVDVWDVAVAALSNPALGLGTAFQKITQRAKEEKEKRSRS